MKRAVPPSALKKHIQDSPRLRELRQKRTRVRTRLAIVFSVFFITLLGGLIYTARYDSLLITRVTVSGTEVTSTEEIVASVEKHLSGNYLLVFPRRNALIYPKKKIREDLVRSFPRLRDIEVERSGLSTLSVTAVEMRGVSLWCGADTQAVDFREKCYFTDSGAIIIDEAPYYSGNVYLRFLGTTELAPGEDPLGKQFISKELFDSMSLFAEKVEELGFHIKAVSIGPGEENAFLLDLGGGKTAPVRFLASADHAVLISNFSSAIGKEELAKKLQEDIKNLEYFDLRFTNKVYYKFSNE